ncbi:MAG: nucleotidyltransferase domain-containing protein [Methanobrevibacter sp.]|jgi:predicted nucleotidyltransferase|nr:nucleotidyltransferase domain-containing protein [Candidatus Methanoflexus mossambicus]
MDRKQLAIDFAKSLNYPEIEKIILFGSVARGDDTTDSDIDILIITKNDGDRHIIEKDLYKKILDIMIKTGELISTKIKSIKYYNKYQDFSFFQNVNAEGIVLKG